MFSENIANGMAAFFKLQIITWAINNDNKEVPEWIPDYKNADLRKWSTVYRVIDRNFLPVQTQSVWIFPSAGCGARLVFKDEERARHADKYFRDLYKDLYML
jgi:hypothetical protein